MERSDVSAIQQKYLKLQNAGKIAQQSEYEADLIILLAEVSDQIWKLRNKQ